MRALRRVLLRSSIHASLTLASLLNYDHRAQGMLVQDAQVELHSLVGRPELNGMHGRLHSWDEATPPSMLASKSANS